MINPLESFNPKNNFWEIFPQFIIGEFKDLYSKDKSKNKEESSLIMWGLTQYCEVKLNKLSSLPEDDRKKIIEDTLKIKLDLKKLQPQVDFYIKTRITQAERSLMEFEKKLRDRDNFLATQEYTEDTWEMIDKMLSATPKLWETFNKLEADLHKEDAEGVSKGGGIESLSDRGDI